MRRFIDELGHQHGRLYVVALADERINGQAGWVCQCECGNYCTVRGHQLRIGVTKSCGGLQKELVAKRAPMAAATRWASERERRANSEPAPK